jgi:hypothetical protein
LWTGRAAPHSLLLRKVAKTKVEKYQKIGWTLRECYRQGDWK